MGGSRCFFIESKLFQLVVEEGGNFFSLRIFERGKYFMQSVFMSKTAAQWLMNNIEHSVIRVNPKQFFTLREGNTAYTLQCGSNTYGQFLAVTELKVGGQRRAIIIPAGKAQQGWRAFGLELRRMLAPTQYASGGSKFIAQPHKRNSEIQSSRSFVEAVKGHAPARDMKQIQHPVTSDHEKPRIVEKIAETPRFDHTKSLTIEYPVGKPRDQVVEDDFQVGKAWPTVVGAAKGRFQSINVGKKLEEKILAMNKSRFPLRFNLNSNDINAGKGREIRNSRWTGEGLVVELKENGRRRVSWDCARGGFRSFKWVARGIKAPPPEYVSLGLKDLEAQNTLVGETKDSLGPCETSPLVFEIGECSKPGFSQNLSSPKVIEAENILCPSAPKPDIPGKSLTEHESSVFGSTATEMSTTVAEMSLSVPAELNNSDGDAQEMSISQAQLPVLPVLTAVEYRSSPVESQVGCEGKVASEIVEIDSPKVFSEEGTHNSRPTIRELVGDLDKSWGNSKDWMLELRDGRQIVIPLSLYRSPDSGSLDSGSECSIIEGEVVPGNNSIATEGQIVSWADECDGVLDSLSVVTGSEDELWEVDVRSMTWERDGEPLVVVPLATEIPLEDEHNTVKECGCEEKVDSKQLSQWVTNRIKAFRKSVGTSLEGFEEQISGLLLALEARKKDKKRHEVDSQKKVVKSGQKGHRELKNLMTSLNVEYGSAKRRSISSERAVVLYQ